MSAITGLGERWLCPDCGRLLDKPPWVRDGRRYHSWHCDRPMIRAVVALAEESA